MTLYRLLKRMKGRGKQILRTLPGEREMKERLRAVALIPVVSHLAVSQGKKGIGFRVNNHHAFNVVLSSLSPSFFPSPPLLLSSGESGTEDDQQKAVEEGSEEQAAAEDEPAAAKDDSSEDEAMQVDTAPQDKESSSEESD